MEWIKFSEKAPKIGMFIAAIRIPYPAYYWIGLYVGIPSEDEDLFDYWLELPEFPENCNCAICDEETRKILDETYHKPIETNLT